VCVCNLANASGRQALLDYLCVDFRNQLDGLVEMGLIVLLGTLSLDVLLDGVDLRLVGYQSLLLLVKPVVDVALKNLVLSCVVFHRMVRRLLAKSYLILADELFDVHKPLLFKLEILAKLVSLWKLVLEFVLHLLHARHILLELHLDSALQVLVLRQILFARFNFDLELGSSTLGVIELALLEV
jgi:hypothetical protein